jgi:hypothetical protein
MFVFNFTFPVRWFSAPQVEDMKHLALLGIKPRSSAIPTDLSVSDYGCPDVLAAFVQFVSEEQAASIFMIGPDQLRPTEPLPEG